MRLWGKAGFSRATGLGLSWHAFTWLRGRRSGLARVEACGVVEDEPQPRSRAPGVPAKRFAEHGVRVVGRTGPEQCLGGCVVEFAEPLAGVGRWDPVVSTAVLVEALEQPGLVQQHARRTAVA